MVHNPSIGENKKIGAIQYYFLYSPLQKREGNWSQNESGSCFWDCHWGHNSQLFPNFFYLSIATVLKVFAKVISLKWQIVIQGCYPLSDTFFFNLSDTCSSEVWKEIKTISTLVSPGEMCLYGPLSSSSGWVLWVRTMFTFPGMIKLKICLPVHRGLGFRIAGCGILPSQSGIHIIRFIIASWR